GYVPVAVRASVLFFALNDLSRIDPMYQFSLDAYIDLFTYSIDRSPKSTELEDRINNLNENTCRALFERHKLLLSFHMVSRILFQAGKMSSLEYFFLLKGGVVVAFSDWMPDECWDNVTELDKLPGFHGMAWEESVFKTSLLFVLSPGVDPTAALIQLAIDVKMFDKFQSLSLGQGQAPAAER
ncbi:putative dynein axonemal heavy chain-like protein, partial [Operophtera brumata]